MTCKIKAIFFCFILIYVKYPVTIHCENKDIFMFITIFNSRMQFRVFSSIVASNTGFGNLCRGLSRAFHSRKFTRQLLVLKRTTILSVANIRLNCEISWKNYSGILGDPANLVLPYKLFIYLYVNYFWPIFRPTEYTLHKKS